MVVFIHEQFITKQQIIRKNIAFQVLDGNIVTVSSETQVLPKQKLFFVIFFMSFIKKKD